MTDKEKIKAEIERLLRVKEETSHLNQSDFNSGRWKGLMEVKSFIDSLPEEPVSDDLNDEIRKYFLSYKGYPHVLDETEREIKKAIIYFANWQKQQMMKGAAKGTVHHFNGDKTATVHYIDPTGVPMCYFTSPEGLKAGDKVKVIIVKDD